MQDLLYDLKGKIVSREGGNGISGRILFEATSIGPITEQDLLILQARLGYHPAGYGHWLSYSNVPTKGGFKHAFKCSASCD